MTKCDNCVCCHCTKIKCSQYPYQKCIRCITEKQLPMYFCDDFILRKPYEKKPMQIRKYVPIHNQLQQIIERLTRIEEMLSKKEQDRLAQQRCCVISSASNYTKWVRILLNLRLVFGTIRFIQFGNALLKVFACFANTFFIGVLLIHEIYNALDGFAVQRYFYFLVVLICSVQKPFKLLYQHCYVSPLCLFCLTDRQV